jgi:molybdopterin-guanine dinucleotide biosynthesis protein A
MQEITGLVVCGGLSTRMGHDKSMIQWHGMAQRYYLYRMLEPLCKKVFISCNDTQAHEIERGYSYIVDNEKYNNTGPIAALLTAFNKYPGDAFLFIGCDYPLIKKEDISRLISNRNKNDVAVSFFNENTGYYEPLLAIYEKGIANVLFENFGRQQYSLQNILKRSSALKVAPTEIATIRSVNTPEDYLSALNG